MVSILAISDLHFGKSRIVYNVESPDLYIIERLFAMSDKWDQIYATSEAIRHAFIRDTKAFSVYISNPEPAMLSDFNGHTYKGFAH